MTAGAPVEAALRKGLEPSLDEPSAPHALGELSIDHPQHLVTLAGEPVELTATEHAVVFQLAVQVPLVLTHGLLRRRV